MTNTETTARTTFANAATEDEGFAALRALEADLSRRGNQSAADEVYALGVSLG